MRARNGPLPLLDNRHHTSLVVTRMLQYLLLRLKVLNQETLRQAAIDNNLGTRWSNQGVGSWIRLDLGGEKTVCR